MQAECPGRGVVWVRGQRCRPPLLMQAECPGRGSVWVRGQGCRPPLLMQEECPGRGSVWVRGQGCRPPLLMQEECPGRGSVWVRGQGCRPPLLMQEECPGRGSVWVRDQRCRPPLREAGHRHPLQSPSGSIGEVDGAIYWIITSRLLSTALQRQWTKCRVLAKWASEPRAAGFMVNSRGSDPLVNSITPVCQDTIHPVWHVRSIYDTSPPVPVVVEQFSCR